MGQRPYPGISPAEVRSDFHIYIGFHNAEPKEYFFSKFCSDTFFIWSFASPIFSTIPSSFIHIVFLPSLIWQLFSHPLYTVFCSLILYIQSFCLPLYSCCSPNPFIRSFNLPSIPICGLLFTYRIYTVFCTPIFYVRSCQQSSLYVSFLYSQPTAPLWLIVEFVARTQFI